MSLGFKCILKTEKVLPGFMAQSLESSFVQRRKKMLCFKHPENAFNVVFYKEQKENRVSLILGMTILTVLVLGFKKLP